MCRATVTPKDYMLAEEFELLPFPLPEVMLYLLSYANKTAMTGFEPLFLDSKSNVLTITLQS